MKKILVSIVALWAVVLAGCGSTSTTNETQIVKVGVIAPISWPAASYGEDAINAYKMAADEFNANNTDYKIELIYEDGKCNGKDATAAAQKLVNVDQVKVILGGVCSAETLAAMEVTQPAGVVLISAVSSNPDISKARDFVYRSWNDVVQWDAIGKQLSKMNAQNVALLYESTDYSVGLANSVKNAAPDVSFYEEKFASEEKDFPALASKIDTRKGSLDAIIFIPSSEVNVVWLLKALDDKWLVDHFRGKILTSEVWAPNTALTSIGEIMEWMLTSQFPDYSSFGNKAVQFIESFKTKYEVKLTEVYLLLYKETFDLVADAISDKEYGVANVNKYIKTLDKDNPRNGLRGSYYYDGVDAVGLNFVMKKVADGKLVTND